MYKNIQNTVPTVMLHQALSEKANWACSLRPGGLRSRRPNWLFQIGFGNILIRPISAENNQFEPLSIDPQQNLVSSDIDRNNLQYRPQQNPVAIQYPHDKSICVVIYVQNKTLLLPISAGRPQPADIGSNNVLFIHIYNYT
jgi:hypothetical protein